MRLLQVVVLAGAVSCGSPPIAGQAMLVTVQFEPSSLSRCAVVRVLEADSPKSTKAIVRGAQTSLDVAIFRDELPATITLEARGFSGEGCLEGIEVSEQVTATFVGTITKVDLSLQGDGSGDGGFRPDAGLDAGPPDAGVEDAGEPDAGLPDAGEPDAGLDAGSPDAGVDAGFDAGVDAGVERCDNGTDDDGDSLVDCVDPDCGNGAACDDGDLCTTGDACLDLACTSQLRSCAGQLPSCMVPTGCDAGVCLAGPAPAFQGCDAGGRCDGAGRCAPFCDDTRAGLRACYRFEGVLTDGSGKGNNATGSSFTYDAGVRGLGWHAGTTGLTVRNHASLDCTTTLTMEAWVRLTAFPATGARFGVLDNDGQYGLFIGPGGEVRCQGSANANVAGALTLDTWHHVACIQGNGTMKAYRGGVEIGTANTTGTLGTGNGNGLTVGMNSPNNDVLRGALDGVRVWCEALSPAELCSAPGDCG